MKYLRLAGAIVGALCVLMGLVWIFQGVNVIPGSFMTGVIDWSYRGAVLVVVGLVALFLSLRNPRAKGQ
jgi:hypothetical protein